MEIVLLAAGLSKRMGSTNKLLLQYKGTSLVCRCASEALKYLEHLNTKSRLIIVTGYRRRSTEKALAQCKLFVEKTDAPIELVIVNNAEYRRGQFSSVKAGVEEVSDNSDFFIALADMPEITAEHYHIVASLKKNYDAVVPYSKGEPGHPVLLDSGIKKAILAEHVGSRVFNILEKYNVFRPDLSDTAFVHDIDTPADWEKQENNLSGENDTCRN